MLTKTAGDSSGVKAGLGAVERKRAQSIQFTAPGAPEEEKAAVARAWLEEVVAGAPSHSGFFEGVAVRGMRVERVGGGTVVCRFQRVPQHLADAYGIWTPGAIASVINVVGAVAVGSVAGEMKVSVAVDISYFAPVKIEEDVEIEGKVSYHAGQLTAVTVDVRKKGSRQPVACGRQWMTSFPGPKRYLKNKGSKL